MNLRIATTENEARFHHYLDVVEDDSVDWRGTIEAPFTAERLSGIDAFICSCEYHWPTRLAIAACKRFGIPTFHVLDGIVEWRNLFENPRSSTPEQGAPLFQPLISDHTFVMGPVQQWAMQWLGNGGVHPTGLPRLDALTPRSCRFGPPVARPRLLVATANTPWFDEAQEQIFKREFKTLVAGLAAAKDPLEIRWRVAAPVAANFGLESQLSQSALEALMQADALITSPSSLAVEAMQLGIPTLVFDPYACPGLNPSAWSASSAGTVLQLLPSLLSPDAHRASLQDAIRDMTTPTDGQAACRIREIIRQVVLHETVPAKPACGYLRPEAESQRPVQPAGDLTWPANLSTAELQGLAASIPALERILHEKNQNLERLHWERERPTLRHALGCLYRSLLRCSK